SLVQALPHTQAPFLVCVHVHAGSVVVSVRLCQALRHLTSRSRGRLAGGTSCPPSRRPLASFVGRQLNFFVSFRPITAVRGSRKLPSNHPCRLRVLLGRLRAAGVSAEDRTAARPRQSFDGRSLRKRRQSAHSCELEMDCKSQRGGLASARYEALVGRLCPPGRRGDLRASSRSAWT